MSDEPRDNHWSLDKKVPLALIVAMVVQTLAAVWWAGSAAERLAALERRVEATAPMSERLAKLEERVGFVQQGIAEIKTLIRGSTGAGHP